MQRRIVPQRLLRQRLGRLLVAAQRGQVQPGGQDRADAIADGVDGGLVAGVEQEDAGRDQLVLAQPVARLARGDELGDEVVGRAGAALSDVAAQESGEGLRRRHRRILHRAGAAELVHRHHACDQASRSPARSVGTPSNSAMTMTGIGVAKASISSTSPWPSKRSISSWASAAMRGLSRSTWRETKARLTSPRSRVWSGGSSSSSEWRSTASQGARWAAGSGQPSSSRVATWRICRPKRRSRKAAATSSWAARHQWPYSSQKKAGQAARMAR